MPHIAERAIQQWKILQEQERIQKALAEREAQFRLLAENSSDIISRHDMHGNILYISPACHTLLGYDPTELIGQPVIPFVHPEDGKSILELLASPTWSDPTAAVPYRARHKNGEYIWLETTARVIYDHENHAIEIQASSRDITERKQSQVALQRANEDLREAYDKTIEGWVLALDLRDRETEGHTQRVTELSLQLARAFGFGENELLYVRWGALLHDIGKMGVPDRILLKEGPLTDEEWVIMRQHPVYAHEMLRSIQYLHPALDIPYCHHEKWDGTGYPRGLKGEEIPLVARLFAIIDVWDALTSDRPYRTAWSHERTLAHIRQGAGQHFDPQVVEMFTDLIVPKSDK